VPDQIRSTKFETNPNDQKCESTKQNRFGFRIYFELSGLF